MLIIASRLRELSFGQLMEVYAGGNRENGWENWPEEPEMRQIALAETDFYNFLDQVFFRESGSFYAVWEEKGRYVSALRLEPYRDGLLLEALETKPDQRRRGYGEKLIRAVLDRVEGNIYCHVAKWNGASLAIHEKCGFRKLSDRAVYADGSVNDRCVTLWRTGCLKR